MKKNQQNYTYKKYLIFIVFAIFCLSCDAKNENNTAKIPEADLENKYDIPQGKVVIAKTVYVPVYSSIYTREEKSLLHLSATLSIRNTSLKHNIVVTSVTYYDTNGKLVKNYIPKQFSLAPLATRDFVIREWELAGGTGANFIVKWKAEHQLSRPIIQAIMISTRNSLGISFVCEGREIDDP